MGLFGVDGRWEGMIGCPLTPFDKEGRIDADVYVRQVGFLLDAGIPALCAVMHVGESLNLSAAERELLARLTIDVAGDRGPVIVHISCPATEHSVSLARHAESVGAQGVVAVTPYHWRPSPEGLFRHYLALGEAVEIPLIAYSYPAAFGVSVTPELVGRLLDHLPNFLGLKDAGHNLSTFTALVRTGAELRPEFSVFSGTEHLLASLALGGAGSFAILGLVAPRLLRALREAVQREDLASARPLQWRVARLLDALTKRYPAGVKAAAEIMGRGVGPTRLPVEPLGAGERRRLIMELDACGVLADEPYGWDAHAEPDPDRASFLARQAR